MDLTLVGLKNLTIVELGVYHQLAIENLRYNGYSSYWSDRKRAVERELDERLVEMSGGRDKEWARIAAPMDGYNIKS